MIWPFYSLLFIIFYLSILKKSIFIYVVTHKLSDWTDFYRKLYYFANINRFYRLNISEVNNANPIIIL